MSITIPGIRRHQTAVFVRNEGTLKAERARRFEQSVNGSNIKVDLYTVSGEGVTKGLDLTFKGESADVTAAKATLAAAGYDVESLPSTSVASVSDDDLRVAAGNLGYNTVVILSGVSL